MKVPGLSFLILPVPNRRKTSSKLNKYYAIVLIAILAFAALVVPYPAEEVPEWKILYIDQNYLPGANRKIYQSVGNVFFDDKSDIEAMTDKNGFVTFPTYYLWASALERIAAAPAAWLGWDTATHVGVSVTGDCNASVTWTVGKSEKPDKLVCPK